MSQPNILPDQKREYLRLLLSEGQQAASDYLQQTGCEGGIFIYKTQEEADAFRKHLDRCCPGEDENYGTWVFLPDNGRG